MSQFGTPFRQNKPPKEFSETPLRSDLTTAPFPALFTPNTQSHSSRPAYPLSRISPVPPILKYGVGDLDGGTVGVLCFIFRFKALSHNRNISWDRDGYLSQGIFKRIWQLQYHNQSHWER